MTESLLPTSATNQQDHDDRHTDYHWYGEQDRGVGALPRPSITLNSNQPLIRKTDGRVATSNIENHNQQYYDDRRLLRDRGINYR